MLVAIALLTMDNVNLSNLMEQLSLLIVACIYGYNMGCIAKISITICKMNRWEFLTEASNVIQPPVACDVTLQCSLQTV